MNEEFNQEFNQEFQQEPNPEFRQEGYQQPYGQYYGQEQAKSTGTGFGIASIVLGVLSIFTFMCCINFILALLAIVFGILQIVRCEKRGLAIGGIVTAAISIVGGIIFWVCAVAWLGTEAADPDSELQQYLQQYEQQYEQDYEYYIQDNGAM